MSLVPAVADRFLGALAARDYPTLASCFGEGARFHALVPRGLREAIGADEATSYFQRWFGAADRVELLASGAESVVERCHLSWRFRVHDEAGWQVIEQQAYASIQDGQIVRMDLLCSGFLPMASPEGALEQSTTTSDETAFARQA